MKWVIWTFLGVSTLAAYAYIGWTFYQFFTGAISHKAGFLASYGVVVGIISMAGLGLAKTIFDSMRSRNDVPLAGYMMVLALPALVGLHAIGKQAGDFDERVLGADVSYFNSGAVFGITMGLGILLGLWLDDKPKS